MWPWEHAIVGYLAYSMFCHAVYRESPNGLEAFTVVFASVLPDLIDKPLAWEYSVFESGYALGHSIFFVVPFAITVGLLARRAGRSRAGIAFGLGYLLHLPSDVFDTAARNGTARVGLMLWPVETVDGESHRGEFTAYFLRLFDGYRTELVSGDLSTYLWLQLGLALFAFVVWLYDGAPVLRECTLGVKRTAVALASRVTERREEPTERR